MQSKNFAWTLLRAHQRVLSPCIGSFWKKLKPLLPNNKPIIDGNNVRLIEDGKVVTDTSITFNNYFTSPIIKEPILNFSEDDFENHTSVVTIRNQSFDLDFSFEQINSGHIADLLLNLNVKKSAGPDGLSPKLLKISAPVIAAPIAKLFNFCINAGTWPREWKLSDVTPAFKKGEVTSKKNYQPISVLSTIPKLFEKVKLIRCTNDSHLSFRITFRDSFVAIRAERR